MWIFGTNIGKLERKNDIKGLIKALGNDDWAVCMGAIEALGRIGETAVEPLIQALKNDKDEDVRLRAASTLGDIGDGRAVEPLIQALENEDASMRAQAVEALEKMGEPAVDPLIRSIKNEDADVRRMAVEALRKMGEPAVEPLIHALEDENVREVAAEALREIGDERAVKPLKQFSRDKNSSVQRTVKEALKVIKVRKMYNA